MVNSSKTWEKSGNLLLLLLAISFSALPALGQYGGGSGTVEDPYQIWTAVQMNAIGANPGDWDKHFKLMADIDLSAFTGTSFNIIGTIANLFTGIFDGNNHTIANFTYNSNAINCIGLFRFVYDPNAQIRNLGLIDPNVDAGTGRYVGSLVGRLSGGTITNCYVETGSVSGNSNVGGLVGYNWDGTITDSYAEGGSVSGEGRIGGLVGLNGEIGYGMEEERTFTGTISNCYSTSSVSGVDRVGGLLGYNCVGTISNCYSSGSVAGNYGVGGLVGANGQGWFVTAITNCYSRGSVSGNHSVGGLVGWNWGGSISNCYSESGVTGEYDIGGLLGWNVYGWVSASFWDTQTSGQTTSDGGTGKTTAEMQTMSTFIDAGWDFNTPVWTIDEGVDYPRLWWELVPVLHAEPEVTLGTSNTITWDPIPGANDYYAECAEDANFTSILYNSGWITETSYEFTGLELGQIYWYSVKARNIACVETNWSNVESSLQGTLADAVDMMLDPESLKNENLKNALLNKINAVLKMLDVGRYEEALNKLQNDVLAKTNGCAETGRPDKNDWIITCEGQSQLYPLVIETIEYVSGLMD